MGQRLTLVSSAGRRVEVRKYSGVTVIGRLEILSRPRLMPQELEVAWEWTGARNDRAPGGKRSWQPSFEGINRGYLSHERTQVAVARSTTRLADQHQHQHRRRATLGIEQSRPSVAVAGQQCSPTVAPWGRQPGLPYAPLAGPISSPASIMTSDRHSPGHT